MPHHIEAHFSHDETELFAIEDRRHNQACETGNGDLSSAHTWTGASKGSVRLETAPIIVSDSAFLTILLRFRYDVSVLETHIRPEDSRFHYQMFTISCSVSQEHPAAKHEMMAPPSELISLSASEF